MDGYLSKLRGLASSAANAVQSKIGRDYDVNLSASPIGESGLWSLFRATRRSSSQQVTVWVFEKRFFEQGINRQLFTLREQNLVLDLLKGEASQLTRLRHPSVLQVVEPLEETRGSLMFVTELVIASLDDLVNPGHKYRSGSGWGSSGRMVDGEQFELDDLETQKGLLQVTKGLEFLHQDAKIVHGNLVPASILINAKGDWKLGGFGFAKHINYTSQQDEKVRFEHDYQMPSHTQQDLDYLAPEFVLEGKRMFANDVFSLACLATAVYSEGRSPLDCRNDVGAYRREIGRLTPDKFTKLPDHLVPSVRSLLTANPAQRLTLAQFQGSKYFDNVLVATIRYLEAIVEQPQEQKIAFMKGLPRVLGQFPDRVLRRKILPALIDQTNDHSLLPFTLPNIFKIVEKLSAKEFVSLALPGLKPAFSIMDPPQTSMVLLENLELLQKKTPAPVFKSDVMPLLYTALLSTVPQVQDKALQAVPTIAESVDYADLKDQVFPRVQHLYSKASVLSLKIRALICLHGMLKALDKGTVADKLLPMLKRTKTREAGVVMTMLVMYEEIGLKYVDKDTVAKEILPQLWAQAVEAQLKVEQFDKFMGVVTRLTDKVKEEMRKQLAGLQRIEEQTANLDIGGNGNGGWGDFNDDEDIASGSAGVGSNDGGFAALVNGSSGEMQNPLAQTPKASAAPMQNPLAPTSPASTSGNSGWEWDSPTFASNPPLSPTAATKSLGKSVPVDTDFFGTSPSPATQDDDDFGSFGSYIPPPKGSLSGTRLAKNVSSRLRTTPTFGQHAGKLGATKVSSPSMASGFGAIPPPPTSSSAGKPAVAKPNYNIGNSFAGMQPMQTKPMQTMQTKPTQLNSVLVPAPKGTPAGDRRDSQSHAGGKASHLGDFDPFA